MADPTCMSREKALQEMHANCFLLVPLMPLCVRDRASMAAIGGGQRRKGSSFLREKI